MPTYAPFIDADLCFNPMRFKVPLNYNARDKDTISVFAREVRKNSPASKNKPWLIYLQGGPGFPSPRSGSELEWLSFACEHYQVLLIDQRGTGNSHVLSVQTLAHLTPTQQSEYLSLFRADNIVRDAEEIRKAMKIEKWAILGQSFGGFCTLTYLSHFPNSLSRCYITGGVAPIASHADDVYQATFERTKEKNFAFFQQFPKAQQLCQKIANYLLDNPVVLPNGQRFTVEQFQQLGIHFGMANQFLPIYYLLENAFIEVNGKEVLRMSFFIKCSPIKCFTPTLSTPFCTNLSIVRTPHPIGARTALDSLLASLTTKETNHFILLEKWSSRGCSTNTPALHR